MSADGETLVVHGDTAKKQRDEAVMTERRWWQRAMGIAAIGVVVVASLVVLIVIIVNVASGAPALGSLSMASLASMASPVACPTTVSTTLVASLDAMRARLVAAAGRQPTLTWSEYAAAPVAGRRVELRQTDFDSGTLRLRTSGVFVLTENVVFSPNAAFDFRVDAATQPEYASVAAFRLGFFAALSVEAEDVVIDLGGYTLEQSTAHSVQQRAPFSLIELASQPFITGEGPTDFGQSVTSANGCVIEHGQLGRSSHHAIHGNGVRRLLVRSVTMRDYEVAAISLHGSKDVVIDSCRADGQFTAVPLLGTYSNARHLVPMVARALAAAGVAESKKIELRNQVARLESLMGHAFDDIVATGAIDETAHPEAHALFANEAGLIDGNAYSLLLHPLGAAVTQFWSAAVPAAGSAAAVERVLVRNSTFAATRNSIVEVVALVSPVPQAIRGPVGALLRLVDNAGRIQLFDDSDGSYVGNALADTQVALMDAALDVGETERAALFGTLHGPREVVRWAHGELTLHQLVADHGYSYWRNGDTMLHVNKGVTAVRVDGARDVCFDRVRIEGTSNTGARGITHRLPGETSDAEAAYTTSEDGGHPLQGQQRGYMGADARAFSVAGSDGVYATALTVAGVHSTHGFARGIDLFNGATNVHFGALSSVDNVTSALVVATDVGVMGTKVPVADGLRCVASSAATVYGGRAVVVTNVDSAAVDQAHLEVVVPDRERVDNRLAEAAVLARGERATLGSGDDEAGPVNTFEL